jgi:hypothetical protein
MGRSDSACCIGFFIVGASVPIPKFASVCGASDANFGIKGTLCKFMILVWFLDLKFLSELAA